MTEKRKKLVEILAKIPQPEGPPLLEAPPHKTVVISPALGDGATNYRSAKLVRITRDNIDHLAGLKPVLHYLEVEISHFGQKRKIKLDKLLFDRGTTHWPALIVQQTPEIQFKVKLLQAIREAKRNTADHSRLKHWLQTDPQGQAALKRISEAAKAQ